MCILSALFYFPTLHAALVSGGLCFFGGIWLVLASSTDWAFCLERLVPCKGRSLVPVLSGKEVA